MVSGVGPVWMGLRVMAAGIAYLVCFVAAYGLVVRGTPPSPGVEPISPGLAILLVSVLNTAVMSWLILRSRLSGWSLAAVMVLLFFGVQTFMPQVESLIFQANPGYASHLPAAVIPRLFLAGLLHAVLWIPLAIRILGRWRPVSSSPGPGRPPALPAGWTWKLPLAALAYVAVYFTFGYYVAWRSPAVTAYYRGTDPGSFWAQIGNVLRDTPWLPAAQALRGLLWTALALVVLRVTKGSRLEKSLATCPSRCAWSTSSRPPLPTSCSARCSSGCWATATRRPEHPVAGEEERASPRRYGGGTLGPGWRRVQGPAAVYGDGDADLGAFARRGRRGAGEERGQPRLSPVPGGVNHEDTADCDPHYDPDRGDWSGLLTLSRAGH